MFRGVDNIEPGMVFTAQGENGHQHITVKSVEGDKVMIDGNHEMAGQTLYFDVEVISIREATEEEIDHGHVHAHGDHHHH
jgi:FKBP-type peptidyl-prolyl cis-trans isomerase SlyD